MAFTDPIQVGDKGAQERRSLNALKVFLDPWMVQEIDQRDDFGRDAVVQIVKRAGKSLAVSPATFFVQCKSIREAMDDTTSVSIDTRHLALWTSPQAATVFLILWSAETGDFRVRFPKDVVADLDRSKGSWRDQDSVRVRFRPSDQRVKSADTLAWIERVVVGDADRHGGIETFHAASRRIVLTALMRGTFSTSQIAKAQAPDGTEITIRLGEGWVDGDLDPYEVQAEHHFVSSLMLYEEVWAPMGAASLSLELVGESATLDLLERGRLKLYAVDDSAAFVSEGNARLGQLQVMQLSRFHPLRERFATVLGGNVRPMLVDRLFRFVQLPSGVSGLSVARQTVEDLKRPNLRRLLGLRTQVRDSEPEWDAPLVNRLSAVNLSRAVGRSLRADTVQYEGGSSRLVSEKDYDSLEMNRLFKSSSTFDAALRAVGTPDVGQLVTRLGVQELINLADSAQAQEFRDWFWTQAATQIGYGAKLTDEFVGRLGLVVGQDPSSLRFPVELKRRYVESLRGEYLIGPARGAAFATTVADGDKTLERQRAIAARRRASEIRRIFGGVQPYSPCVCGTKDLKFKFCCGRHAENN